jgi:hypothetical protein
MSEFKITIPKPCREDWNQMTPIAQGRACAICKKNVLDFTRKSDAEVYRSFKQDPKRICGRFNESQLNRWIEEREIKKKTFWKPVAAAGILAFLGYQEVKGNPITSTYLTYQEPIQKTETIIDSIKQSETLNTDSILISGTVFDSVLNEPIPFANVFVEEGKFGCQTDFDGKFVLKIPGNMILKHVFLTVSYIGYPQIKTDIEIKENMNTIDIVMGQQLVFLGDVVVVKASLWQRIKWKFKKK